jgi:hypothetical protein
MQVGVRVVGVELAQRRLEAQSKSVVPVLRGTLNTGATATRTERYVKPLRGTIKPAQARKALRVKRANSRRLNSRIIPSSSGVPITNYQSWGFDPIDATRARIWVKGPNGKKVAAGFVNPSSRGKLPLANMSSRARNKSTGSKAYSYKVPLGEAMAPSVAYWFKQLSGNQTIRWTNIFLQKEFEKRIRRELAKG